MITKVSFVTLYQIRASPHSALYFSTHFYLLFLIKKLKNQQTKFPPFYQIIDVFVAFLIFLLLFSIETCVNILDHQKQNQCSTYCNFIKVKIQFSSLNKEFLLSYIFHIYSYEMLTRQHCSHAF